eukprot:3262227-Pyramimonas_sp.AAC.1
MLLLKEACSRCSLHMRNRPTDVKGYMLMLKEAHRAPCKGGIALRMPTARTPPARISSPPRALRTATRARVRCACTR